MRSKKTIFENLKQTQGFKVIAIISHIYNYLDFLSMNYNILHDKFNELQNWTDELLKSDNFETNRYQMHLDFSCFLLNFCSTAKALAEKCMGWRNHFKKPPFSWDIISEYKAYLSELDLISLSELFNPLRNDFLHKLDEEATIQYFLNLCYIRNKGAIMRVFSNH